MACRFSSIFHVGNHLKIKTGKHFYNVLLTTAFLYRVSQCNLIILQNKKLIGNLISKIKSLSSIYKHMFQCRDAGSVSYSPLWIFFKRCSYNHVHFLLYHQRLDSLRIAWCGFKWSTTGQRTGNKWVTCINISRRAYYPT